MKKYFIGMLALVLAIGFSAFTKPVKNTHKAFFSPVTLYLDASPLVASNIETEENWKQITGSDCEVIQFEDQACRMTVESTDLKVVNSVNVLDPAKITLSASAGARGTTHGYIASKSGGSSSTVPVFENRQDQ